MISTALVALKLLGVCCIELDAPQRKKIRSVNTYDANGNTTKTDSTGTTNYTWDSQNRLSSVTLPGTGGTVTFTNIRNNDVNIAN